MITDDRIQEIARSVFDELTAYNSEVIHQPHRWHEPMESWTREQLDALIVAAIKKALAEDHA